ncbi:TIGR02221 family CRISPR-associated protein [Carboxydothermus hydrogenoformans]|uniref:Conserved domain protein n=1 Tax=Carboxydothermus hydrogenoformans (strain ATCC BAA-161 / DSM 6008 / Z-2901) TaxID=246194 RepID=Q3AA96_CARHZ|nr:TIGR02221 family CRISPR-associated protein [Carboxydothermus hydrogenoformans]ABB13876.1 conserved domain protein [Carboxydothermus hydrogenoformans Z-2901]
MRVKLISFLGTNKYIPCRYKFEEEISSPSYFIQMALVELLTKKFSYEIEAVIFTTDEAFEKNWLKGEGYPGLVEVFNEYQQRNPKFKFRNVMVPSGLFENEIIKIFSKIYNEVEENDNLVFDLTHSFRSLPFLTGIILNYTRLLKNVNILGVYYGAFEVLGPVREVEEKYPDVNDRVAPVISLNYFLEISDWVLAADSFLNSGNAGRIAALAQKGFKSIESPEVKRNNNLLQKIAREINKFSLSIATCRALDLAGETRTIEANGQRVILNHKPGIVESLKEMLENAAYDEIPELKPFYPIINKIKENFKNFTEDVVENINHITAWCLEHDLVMQGYTFLRENIITALCLLNGFDEKDQNSRELQGKIATTIALEIPEDKWNDEVKQYRDFVYKILSEEALVKAYKLLNKVSIFRNELAHCQYTGKDISAEKFKNRLSEHLKEFVNFYQKNKLNSYKK